MTAFLLEAVAGARRSHANIEKRLTRLEAAVFGKAD